MLIIKLIVKEEDKDKENRLNYFYYLIKYIFNY